MLVDDGKQYNGYKLYEWLQNKQKKWGCTGYIMMIQVIHNRFRFFSPEKKSSEAHQSPVAKDGIVGIMSKPLVDLPDACKPLALTKAGEAPRTERRLVFGGKPTLGTWGI